jgi:hypothetical protein
MSAFQEPAPQESIYCHFLNCKHTTYSAKTIITLQSTDVPHVTWKIETNSATHLQPSTSRDKKNAGSSEEPVTVRG